MFAGLGVIAQLGVPETEIERMEIFKRRANLLLFLPGAETKFWGTMVILLIAAMAYLGNRFTKGYTIGYINYKMSDRSKRTLMYCHGIGSLILALALPNNYLNEIEFIKRLYEENELWIAGSILMLLFTFLIVFGTIFTIIVRLRGLEKVSE